MAHAPVNTYKVTDSKYGRRYLSLSGELEGDLIAYNYEHPVVTVDLVQFNSAGTHVLMMKRGPRTKPDSFRGSWALPGGHYEKGEDPMMAALRECREETGIQPLMENVKFIAHAYASDRDPRQWAFGLIYSVIHDCDESEFNPEDKDESVDVAWIAVNDIENGTIVPAFDHAHWIGVAHKQMFGL